MRETKETSLPGLLICDRQAAHPWPDTAATLATTVPACGCLSQQDDERTFAGTALAEMPRGYPRQCREATAAALGNPRTRGFFSRTDRPSWRNPGRPFFLVRLLPSTSLNAAGAARLRDEALFHHRLTGQPRRPGAALMWDRPSAQPSCSSASSCFGSSAPSASRAMISSTIA